MDYLIGDVQGCDEALGRLLDAVGFSPSRDTVVVLGDMVNRGPDSLAVLRRLRALGGAAHCVLGNHDLHLLAVAHGVRQSHRSDTVAAILEDERRVEWLDWVRTRRLALSHAGWLCVHAGVVPAWTVEDTLTLAREVEAVLAGPDIGDFLQVLYGNEPRRWDPAIRSADRWRHVINVLTRIRFCAADGTLEFETKDGADAAPPGFAPWFAHPSRRTAGVPVAFGHWSTLGLIVRPDLMALDTGCVWGRQLTAVRVDGGRQEVVQVDCPQA